jgi:hypothetical protein
MQSLLSALKLEKTASRRLGVAATVLGLSATVHLFVLVATGGDWSGAVSFRKPLTFGISVGLLLWTCGWVMDRLPARKRRESVLAKVLIGSGLVEVGLITAQAWRGVPSHFNFTTTTDSIIFSAMGASIAVFSLALVALTIWAVLRRPSDRSTRLAVLAGMVLVITGLGLGQWVIGLGVQMAEQLGHAPETVLAGEAGVAKFPHAMALHGIQLFIGASIVARLGRLDGRRQLNAVRMTVGGYLAIVAWSIVHTNAGRAPLDLSGVESALILIGMALLAAAGVVIAAGFRSSLTPDTAPEAAVTLTS